MKTLIVRLNFNRRGRIEVREREWLSLIFQREMRHRCLEETLSLERPLDQFEISARTISPRNTSTSFHPAITNKKNRPFAAPPASIFSVVNLSGGSISKARRAVCITCTISLGTSDIMVGRFLADM